MEKFKPVEVIKSFLGVKKGTVLKFDEASSKYISRSAEEQVGDGEYYYSGNAVALDPVIIEANIDKIFKVLEVKQPEPIVEETPKAVEYEEKSAEEEIPVPQGDNVVHQTGSNLMFECGLCRNENFISYIKNGVFLPAVEGTSINLKCTKCGIETKLYYKDEVTENSK